MQEFSAFTQRLARRWVPSVSISIKEERGWLPLLLSVVHDTLVRWGVPVTQSPTGHLEHTDRFHR